jgi:hypothetical protein
MMRTFNVMEQRRRRALETLKYEHVLRERDTLDAAVNGVRLSAREEEPEEVANFLAKLQTHLPDFIRDDSMLREDDNGKVTLVIEGGSLVGALPMRGGGENWLVVVIATTIMEAAETEFEPAAIDAVNSRMPGMLFVGGEHYAAFINGAATPTRKAGNAWRELCVRLLVENHARANRFVVELVGGEEDEITRYWRAERSLADEVDVVEGNLRLLESFKNYLQALPEKVRPLTRLRERTEAIQIELPYYRRGGSENIVVRARYIDGNSGMTWAPAGIHYFAEIPEDLPHDTVVERASALNGMGPDSTENDMHTTPWLLGTWQSAPSANGSRLLYHGYVPSTLFGLADLDSVLAGVIREIFNSRRKLDVSAELENLKKGALADVQET